MFCELEGWEAVVPSLLQPRLSASPLVERREVCIALLEADTKDGQADAFLPGPVLSDAQALSAELLLRMAFAERLCWAGEQLSAGKAGLSYPF